MQKNLKEDIQQNLDIVDVVNRYTTLTKSGNNLKTKSPFTNEKTPSFIVNKEKGLFYCFSSHKGGDMFTFIQEIEGVDFKQSLKILAEFAGLEVDSYIYSSSTSKTDKSLRENLVSTLEMANQYFSQYKKDTVKYLNSRGIKDTSIESFELGYSPIESNLVKFCNSINIDLLKKSGLVANKSDGNVYERFRERIMFPLRNEKDELIGFAGRIIKENQKTGKYINSPQTMLYDKSTFLYGLNKAKNFIKKYNYAIITEGYLDVIVSHQNGFFMTIAVSGTSATVEHFKLLKRYTKNIIFAFDGDAAGVRSVYRSANIALSQDFCIKVIRIDDNKDPADIISTEKDLWVKKIKNANSLLNYIFKDIDKKTEDPHIKTSLVYEEVLPIISKIKNKLIRQTYINEVEKYLNIDKDMIEKMISLFEDIKEEKKLLITPESNDLFKRHSDNFLSNLSFLRRQKPSDIDEIEKLTKRIFNLYNFNGYIEDKGLEISIKLSDTKSDAIKEIASKIKEDFYFLARRLLRLALEKKQIYLIKEIEKNKNKKELDILSKECKNIVNELQLLSKENEN